ncbi:N-carbamoyl-L-amino acid hydrolase [Serratia ficaria]|uniref:N-carbamoyl-L-amino acid hydrolase n=2 Tax=Serratia ficaria TaxID=61651 RepID=A0A240ALS2_SERFI|nr:N-carbamoyl-L-amino-acid hydrolase [Serratia ficaria]CAI0941580.1 N-carbamoyl-L-amino acid hydrolase [Serratia ficaria]CAI0957485.1 N-carbamoyl-L-amino acid hydrolase [Serratia ficaria]CAI1039396.1 N-carbamoyl-L-amino acid hydrolase [Serratia ficaria]CAI2063673.1 N-carbamoyl-L-amino acid hydrolase [Serratia ficaria]
MNHLNNTCNAEEQNKPLTVNGIRLWENLMDMAAIGATKNGGNSRLALSAEDSAGRYKFINDCKRLGMTVVTDAIGNMFCRYEGSQPELDAVVVGSHLDTQPKGGRFDGVYGVLAALEAVRTLSEKRIIPKRSIEIAVWTNEEGARFTPAMMGSAVFTGVMKLDDALRRKDAKGISVAESLHAEKWIGGSPLGRRFDSYFEAHIEQGPILEELEVNIGVVTGGQAISWLDITVTGCSAHAGTTPMKNRSDALLAVAEMAGDLEKVALTFAPLGLLTIGELTIASPSRNTIPGEVTFTLDLRHPEDEKLTQFELACRQAIVSVASRRGMALSISEHWLSPATPFDHQCIELVDESVKRLGYPYKRMLSGAGHDAINISKHCPSAMIFIPCAGGISHNESESIEPIHAEQGANVLINSVLARANH